MPHRDLDVLDAAEGAAVLVDDFIHRSGRRLAEARQLRKAAMGVPLNISEGFARALRADRDYKLRVARGEAEEAMSCLRTNYRSGRVRRVDFRPLHNRYVTIVKMLDSLLSS